jgi:hypothetical protein
MAVIDEDLAKSLVMVKTRPMFFAFIPKGPKSALLLSKKKVTPKQVKQLKAEVGSAGKVIRGRCLAEDGGLAFETGEEQKNPDAFALLLKKTAKAKAGKVIKVVAIRWVKDLDIEPDDVADLTEQLAEEDAQRDVLAEGDLTAEPDDDAHAEEPVEDVEAPVVDDEPEPVPSAVDTARAALTARFKALLPVLRDALKNDAIGPRIRGLMQRVHELAAANDMPAAHASLDEAEQLARNPGQPFPPADRPLEERYESEREQALLAQRKGDFTRRVRELIALLGQVKTLDEAAYQRLSQRLAVVGKESLEELDVTEPGDELLAIEAEALEILEEAATPPLPSGTPLAEPWRQAMAACAQQIEAYKAALKATQDPDFILLADSGLGDFSQGYNAAVESALTQADRASGDVRARAAALTALDGYRAFLKADPLIRLLDTNSLGVAVTLRSTLLPLLATLTRALAA